MKGRVSKAVDSVKSREGARVKVLLKGLGLVVDKICKRKGACRVAKEKAQLVRSEDRRSRGTWRVRPAREPAPSIIDQSRITKV